jgi:uncharacterized protein (DUF736 family)
MPKGDHSCSASLVGERPRHKKDKPYLSVKIDGLMFVAPINCALIKKVDGFYDLVWRRKTEEWKAPSVSSTTV